jgi:hypothetical protein
MPGSIADPTSTTFQQKCNQWIHCEGTETSKHKIENTGNSCGMRYRVWAIVSATAVHVFNNSAFMMYQPCSFEVQKQTVACAWLHIKQNDLNKTYQTQCLPGHFRFDTCCCLFQRITQTILLTSLFKCYNTMCKRYNSLSFLCFYFMSL